MVARYNKIWDWQLVQKHSGFYVFLRFCALSEIAAYNYTVGLNQLQLALKSFEYLFVGTAKMKIGDKKYDFIMAIGDDWTDEYTFEAMPEEAYTIKVGTKTTKAALYIESVKMVRELLNNLPI